MLGAGDILQNRYRIKRPLGRGGMGAVYEATDLRLSRTVALKETLVETDELRRAFEREARLLANLRHCDGQIVVRGRGEFGGVIRDNFSPIRLGLLRLFGQQIKTELSLIGLGRPGGCVMQLKIKSGVGRQPLPPQVR